ncbi:RNA-directed DNA polymerase [Flavobacterium sp.]|uniref:RNA-directed DNA polymerase n=1 Tax=Flavobacterium sp. TaxID=239 RepID=UPI002636611B|nr:RNA-directed DNA polymerase [Flavobacterium sp.]
MDNLILADKKARKGKSKQYGIRLFDKNPEGFLVALREILINQDYHTSEYSTFKVFEPKERIVYRLPYYPDRITHHAIMNVLEPIFTGMFTNDTYSCIKGKGIHAAKKSLQKSLLDESSTKYCLKLDIKKFYPSVDHEILKNLLRRKFKDYRLLKLLDEIIDSTDGIPIGNYLSQYFANFYLTGFDHWIKETIGVKYYWRYADDIVICADNKDYLHNLFFKISQYFDVNLKLIVKNNYQVFPIAKSRYSLDGRGIDFLGYVFFRDHIMIRKSIKKNFVRKLKRHPKHETIAAYWGWLIHADTKNLQNKLLTHEQLQRFQNRTKKRRVRWRKNKDC